MKKIRNLLLSCLMCGWVCAAQGDHFSIPAVQKIYVDTLNAAVDFWTSPEVIDPAGGFHAWFDADGKRIAPGSQPAMDKMLQVQLRILYAHGMALAREKDPAERARLRKQYDHGFAFLERYRDAETGLFISSLTEKNEPLNRAVRASSQACMIHMMSVFGKELQDEKAAALAWDTFARFDRLFYDEKHGGYFDFPGGNSAAPQEKGMKSINSNLHSTHALCQLLKLDPTAPVVRARLEELMSILTSDRILHPSGNAYMNAAADWTPLHDGKTPPHELARHGMNAELVWYLLEVGDVLKIPSQKLLPWAERIARNIMENATSPKGEISLYGPYGKQPDTFGEIIWWGQTESMVMLARLYELTGKKEYFDMLSLVTRCSVEKMQAPNGVWYAFVDLRTGKRGDQGGYGWKSGMHVIRAMIELDRVMEHLQKSAPAKP